MYVSFECRQTIEMLAFLGEKVIRCCLGRDDVKD